MKRFLWTMLCAIALNARADDAAILDKDFQTMMAWLPGVYDNQEQVYFEEEQGVDEALRHQRVHSVFKPVELKAFGEHVFYVQNGDLANRAVPRGQTSLVIIVLTG